MSKKDTGGGDMTRAAPQAGSWEALPNALAPTRDQVAANLVTEMEALAEKVRAGPGNLDEPAVERVVVLGALALIASGLPRGVRFGSLILNAQLERSEKLAATKAKGSVVKKRAADILAGMQNVGHLGASVPTAEKKLVEELNGRG